MYQLVVKVKAVQSFAKKLPLRMVYISLPPEQPATVELAADLTVASGQPPTQVDSSSYLLNDLPDDLLGASKEGATPLSIQPSVASLLAQQVESELPTLPPSRPDSEPADRTPADTDPATVEPSNPDSEATDPETDPETADIEESGRSETESVDVVPSDGEDAPETENSIDLDDLRSPESFASQLQLSADRQEFDPVRQTVVARGNVVLRLNDAIIETDELWVNLINRYALAEGDVLLTRGAQLVRGRRLEYNFIQQAGVIGDAVGTLYLPDISEDFSSPLAGASASRRAYDPINRNLDLQIENDGSLIYGTRLSTQPPGDSGSGPGSNALLNQLRFEADELAFDVEGWRADSVRITNDPFSPPELELRTDGLLLRSISATQDELLLRRPRLVFDQGLALPLVRSRIILDRGEVNPEDLNPVAAPVGIDGSDRGGFYIGRKIPLIASEKVRFSVTPQFFAGRALSGEDGSFFSLRNFGATTDLTAQLSPRTTLEGNADITAFNPSELTENVRATLRANQLIGNHRLSLQYSYRERLFNGSLGFQNVQSSLGAVLLSPEYALGNTGLRLTYQASAQLINAASDRQDLLIARGSDTGRITAARYQGSVALGRGFNLWRGEPKPPTSSEGLRFTPRPIVPYLNLNTGVRTTLTSYSTGDAQNSFIADIGLEAQLGHLSRNFGDYTRLNVAYSQSFLGKAASPFLFDREVDRNVLTLGIVQQIYGPFLLGFQTALSFSERQAINNIYSLEYSRRTYGLLLRYDAVQNTGSIGFRLSNFRWIGDTNPFDTPRIRQVQGGVIEAR